MIKVENIEVFNIEGAIRGMRNPMNSWERSDSDYGCCDQKCTYCDSLPDCKNPYKLYHIGENDLALMRKLYKGGSEHRKYLRQIFVSMDIIAPLYWWKEFDTYKVGAVSNSCSTMHKIHSKEFELNDFSHEHLTEGVIRDCLEPLVTVLNNARELYVNYDKYNELDPTLWEAGINCKKDLWWQMIQLLPSSYNQKRTITMSYETAVNIIHQRRNHKLDEWRKLCEFLLCECPYLGAIMGE